MNLDEFLNVQANQKLDEGAKEIFGKLVGGATSLFNKIVGPVKTLVSHFLKNIGRVFVKNLNGKKILVAEESATDGQIINYLYPDVIVKAATKSAAGGANQISFMRVYIPNDTNGNAVKVVFDEKFENNSAKANNLLRESREIVGNRLFEGESDSPRSKNHKNNLSFVDQQQAGTNHAMKNAQLSTEVGIHDIGAGDVADDQDFLNKIETSEVNLTTLSELFEELFNSLIFRHEKGEVVPSLLLLGYPGTGKTALVNTLKSQGAKVHIIEIASVYKEILGGIPVITNGVISDEVLARLDANVKALKSKGEVESDVITKYANGETVSKKVVMMASDLLPEEDGGYHIMFFDEFNRDSDKMAAAMNLMLSGSIGTQYHLPIKTMVVCSGNLGVSIDGVKVTELDSATFDRYTAKVTMAPDYIKSGEYTDSLDADGKMNADRLTWLAQHSVLPKVDITKFTNLSKVIEEKYYDPAPATKTEPSGYEKLLEKYKSDPESLAKVKKLNSAGGNVKNNAVNILYNDVIKGVANNPTSLNIWLGSLASKYGFGLNKNCEVEGKDSMNIAPEIKLKPLASEYTKDGTVKLGNKNLEYQITPRTLTTMSQRLKKLAVIDWIKAKEGLNSSFDDPHELVATASDNPMKFRNVTKKWDNFTKPEDWEKEYNSYEQKYKAMGIFHPAALYLHIMQWSNNFLPEVLRTSFGGQPSSVIQQIEDTVSEAVKETKIVTAEDVMFGYLYKCNYGHKYSTPKGDQELDKDVFKQSAATNLTLRNALINNLPEVVLKYKGKFKDQIIRTIGENGLEKIIKLAKKYLGDLHEVRFDQIVYANISSFLKESKVTSADLKVLLDEMKDRNFTTESDGEKGVKYIIPIKKDKKGADAEITDADKALAFFMGGFIEVLQDYNPELQAIESILSGVSIEDQLAKESGEKNEDLIIEQGLRKLFERL
jgi:hypothetical protein